MMTSQVFWRVFAVLIAVSLGSVMAWVLVCGFWPAAPIDEVSWGLRCAAVFAGIGIVALVIARWVMLRVAVPLDMVTLAAEQLADGAAPLELPAEAQAYPGRLVTTFQAMSQRVSTRIAGLESWREQLDQNNQQLAIVLEAMVEGVVAVDQHERILLANTAAIRLLDLNPRGLAGRPIWEAVRLPRLQELVKDTLAGEDQGRREIEVPRTQLTLGAVVSRLPGEPCPGAVIVLQDVTDLRRLENLRREFVSNVSHELKTPLAAISAYAETLLDGALDDPDINRGFVGRIGEQAERLHTLILDLLELARVETEAHAFDVSAIEIGEVLRASVDEHQDVAKSKALRLTADAPAEAVWGFADPEGLQTIADNLIDNAINYTPSAGRIAVRWRRDGEWIVIEVEDTGVGIAKENQVRIFERFFRVDRARSREVGGTGLGLSIVKHLCQVFGGQVKVVSQLGRGSTFTVRLRGAKPVANPAVSRLNEVQS